MRKSLKTVLQIGSAGRPVNPKLRYGGTDKVIYYLDREYSKLGLNSIVAASGDSKINGKLIPTISKSYCLWDMNGETNSNRKSRKEYEYWTKQHFEEIIRIIEQNSEIDIIHDHPGTGLLSGNIKRLSNERTPIIITLHADFSDKYKERCLKWKEIGLKRGNVYFNTISNSQKFLFEEGGIPIESTIYHGIPLEEFPLQKDKQDYLFSLGRICPKKGQDLAIKVAREAKKPLILGGVVNSIYHNYWSEKIEPFLDFSIVNIPLSEQEKYKNNLVQKLNAGEEIIGDGQIIYVGSLNDKQKAAFYGKANGFLMPIRWPEPFGLTMIESMACGTPVIAYSLGSVPEIITNGITGRVIQISGNEEEDVKKMGETLKNIEQLRPQDCRIHVEKNFSIQRESEEYLNLYKRIIN